MNPTLAGLIQPPYSPLLGQGVCDLRQARGVRDMSKTISFFCKVNPGFARPTGHVFVTVQDHLGGERRMSADLDGDMSPLGIEDMKRVVVYIGVLTFQVVVDAHIPYRCRGAAHQ